MVDDTRCGMSLILNFIYSDSTRSDIRYILEISLVQYFSFSVETTEFQCALIVSIDAVCVVTSPSYCSRLPPTQILTRKGLSTFPGR